MTADWLPPLLMLGSLAVFVGCLWLLWRDRHGDNNGDWT